MSATELAAFRAPGEGGEVWWDVVESPIGELCLTSDGEALTALVMDPPPAWFQRGVILGRRDPEVPVLSAARRQLAEYFAGTRQRFELPLAPAGTDFQRRVWRALLDIPFGQRTSYGQLATSLGRPDRARAVGAANGRNPISVIVPCHRVVGADGSLVGFGGGLPRKRALLDLEAGRPSLAIG